MFRDPLYLLAMAVAAAASAFCLWQSESRRRAVGRAIGREATLSRLIAPETAARRRAKALLRMGALGLLFVAAAGPQWGVELVTTRSATKQVVIAIDTSLSMTTEDVKPSRLERAKQEMAFLLDSLQGARVGVVAFAGEAAFVCPLTTDLGAAKQILRELKPGMVPVPGTGIGKAVRLASGALARYPGQKALVLLSDGEDHRTDPGAAADEAAAHGIRIYSVGVGTTEGEPIPLRDPSTGSLIGYKKDRKGATVVSRLGEKTLADVAQRTQGAYFRSSAAGNEASEIAGQIEKQTSSQGVESASHLYQNHFMIPLSVAVLLLLIELLIPERKGALAPVIELAQKWGGRKQTVSGHSLFTLAALSLILFSPRVEAAGAESALRQGNKLYEQQQYGPALEQYAVAGQSRPNDSRPVFNAGDALYRLEQYDKSSQAFAAVAGSSVPASVRVDALYNLGNSRFQAGDYASAVSAYRQALTIRPDEAARKNLAVALHHLKNPPPKNKKDQKQNQQPKPQDQKRDKNQRKDSGGKNQPPPPKTRPQDQMSQEDAQRILRAVADKEKSAQINLQKAPQKRQDVEEDW